MNIDIFIKTFPADYKWLPYLLQSIDKNCTGFRKVVIIGEGHIDVLKQHIPETKTPVVVSVIQEIPDDPRYKKRVCMGYQHQKAIKMIWPGFTDADAVLQVDSDMIFCRPTTPEDFTQDGSPVWLRKEWTECNPKKGEWKMWGAGIEWFARGHPAIWNYMIRPGFLITREASNGFFKFVRDELGFESPIELFMSLEIPHCSVYNTFGLFLDLFARRYDENRFGYKLLTEEEFGKPCPLLQFWSWGGLTEDIKTQLEHHLSSDAQKE